MRRSSTDPRRPRRPGSGVVAALAVLLSAPAALVPSRLKERSRRRGEQDHAAEAPTREPEDESARAERLAAALARANTAEEAAELLLRELVAAAHVDAAVLALLEDDERRAAGFAAVGADAGWWRNVIVDLEAEPSGIGTAARERTPFAVYDIESAANVSRRLAAVVGAKSAAFVPLLAGGRAVAVAVLAATAERRFFSAQELHAYQTLANAAAPVIQRGRSEDATRGALARERLVAELARAVRSRAGLDHVLAVAVRETGRALRADRCLVRLGRAGEPMPIASQWHAPGLGPVGPEGEHLPVVNVALRKRRTTAFGDIETAAELDDDGLGGRERLRRLGVRSAAATPIVVFDQVIGGFAVHRGEISTWTTSDIATLEAVAGELGLAIHATRLLDEDARRLGQQAALLNAAQVVTSDLRFDSVLKRLVEEVATLFRADAADCWMFEPDVNLLRCRAVYGLPEEEVGRRIAPAGTFAEAIETREPALKRDFARTESPPPSRNFADFEEVMVAPMTWLGEVRGVLGVCSRERGHFNSSELEVLDAFARFASLASHNAESFEERERQAQIQQGFYRIAEVLGSPLSLQETFDALAQAAAEALGGDSAAVLTPSADGLRLAGAYELPPALASRLSEGLAPEATPFPGAARDERIVSSTGIRDDERFDPSTRELLEEHGYAALLAAPVVRTVGDHGTVVVLYREEGAFSDDDLALARHLSRAARGALERSDLYEAERRARDLAQRLATVGAALVTNLDPSLVVQEVVREAPGLVAADAAAIRLLEGDELVVRAASGPGTAGAAGTRSSSGAGLLGEVVQSRRPAAVEDARALAPAGRGDPLLAETMEACVAVPMMAHGGGLHGVVSVYAASPRSWRGDEVQALLALAAMASAALSNAELYQRVAEEKERNDAILGNIADGIVATDRDGRIVLWNSMAEQITGVPASEALGRRVVEALQRELASEDGEATGERGVAIPRGGKEIWLSLTEAVMRDASGTILGRIFAFRDVSSERAVEQLKSDFVATVSHELRTPLTSIYGFAETLMREDVAFGEAERATFLGYIASESERLIGIVDDLLNVARLEAGMLGIATGATDVGEVLRRTLAEFEADGNGHRFVLEVPDGPLEADADRSRLADVVRHLVDNAVKFSPEGGTITVAARRKSEAVEVRVVDEGVGISPADRQRIFTKFFRGEAGPLATTQGTGVGLFLARGLLAAMRGRIWVESEEGVGSSFVFELPVSNAREAGTPGAR